MVDTNYITSIAKILESPIQKVFNYNIPVAEFRVQFSETRKNQMVNLIFWGNLANDVSNCYQINDYIIIEGYLSLNTKYISDTVEQNSKKFEITVLKIYPFFLNSSQSSVKN